MICLSLALIAVAEIPLTKGMVAIVDDGDVAILNPYSWCASYRRGGIWYASGLVDGKRMDMHRFLMNAPNGWVDHRNHDGLDNRRANLRIATPSQNIANSRKHGTTTSSRYKGVSLFKRTGQWTAQIGKPKRHLGYFATEESAALAYDRAAIEVWGEFANPNFPKGSP